MATDITPATCTFVTADMKGVSGEIYPSDTWQKMSDNGGFNQYTMKMLGQQMTQWTEVQVSRTFSSYAYMAQGTYTVYASGYGELTGSSATIEFGIGVDGTAVIVEAGAPYTAQWTLGSATVIIAADAWTKIEYWAEGDGASNTATLNYGGVYCQRNSR